MIENSNGQILIKVNGLYNSRLRFDFLLTLKIIINTMICTLPLSRKLQSPTFDISEAKSLILSALIVLTNQRNENDFKDIFKKSEDMANKFNIEVNLSRIANKQRNRLNISSESNTPESYYRISVYYPYLDALLSEIKYRFETKNTNILNLKGFIPKYCNSSEVSKMLDAALLFTTDLPSTFDELEGELKTWHVIWKEKPEDDPSIALETIFLPLIDFYPNIKRLLLIFATIPVTTCTSERSFSSLKRIKTYLRSTMGENRLNGLALLNIHPEIIINPEEVVDIYANKHPRRFQLL